MIRRISKVKLTPIHISALRLTSSFFCCKVGGLRLVDILGIPSFSLNRSLHLYCNAFTTKLLYSALCTQYTRTVKYFSFVQEKAKIKKKPTETGRHVD